MKNITSSDSGHSSQCEVISISDESNSETEFGDLTRHVNLTKVSQKKLTFEDTSEQVAETYPNQEASNKDSSQRIPQRSLQMRDVIKAIIKRYEFKLGNGNVDTETNERMVFLRKKFTDVMIRRALLEQINEEERCTGQAATKSNLEMGNLHSAGDVPCQESVKNMEASRENFPNLEKNENNQNFWSQQNKTSCTQTSESCEDISELTRSQHAMSKGEETSLHNTAGEPGHRNDKPVPSPTPRHEVTDQLHPCNVEQHVKDGGEQRKPLDLSRRKPAERVLHGATFANSSMAFYKVQQHDSEDKAEESNGSSNDEASPDSEESSKIQFYDVSTQAKRRYQCGLCGKVFTQLSMLKGHVKTHTRGKPYTCKICSKAFSHSSNFNRHERLVHTGAHDGGRHWCPVCFKAFSLSHHLKEHFRMHNGERPYQSKTSRQRFKQLSTLKTQQKQHNSSSPTHNSSQQVSPKLTAPHTQALSPNPQARSSDSKEGRLVAHTYHVHLLQ
ncbi:zinc finger protein 572-like [Ptychodera flava]|uniref:zinc finger protein 572-like n=1 Tax=Ptychodera flava TaxID=63121 RepID=UPI00396A44D8